MRSQNQNSRGKPNPNQRSGSGGPPQGGGRGRGGPPPRGKPQGPPALSFGVGDARKEDALVKAAVRAREAVQKAGRNAEKIMEVLADFHDDWWELGADDATEKVHDFLVRLVEKSGADLDAEDAWEEIHLGLYGMECIQDEGLAETVAELEELEDPNEGAAQVGAFVDEILRGLTEQDTARIPGFGTFRVERERGEDDEVLATVVWVADPLLEERAAALLGGKEEEAPAEKDQLPHGAVVEAMLDAFMNEWAVDLEGLGTFAALRSDDEKSLDLVFKASLDLRDDLGGARVVGE